jgi:two-component system response regulator AtoC
MASVLLIERDKLQRWAVTQILESAGHEVYGGDTLADARAYLDNFQPAALLIDRALPDGLAFDFIRQHRVELNDTAIVLMTAVEQVSEAADALRLQLAGYLRKPVSAERLQALLDRSLERLRLLREAEAAQRGRELELEVSPVAESPSSRQVLHQLQQFASTDARCLLIRGARGTGKTALANHLHAMSHRRRAPLLGVQCHVQGKHSLEEVLFGRDMVDTEGRRTSRRGLLELAHGGTLVFEEIANLPASAQSRLLELIESGYVRRTGSHRQILTDVRIVAITSRDLEALERRAGFNRRLLQLLTNATVEMAPLRERPEDILPFARSELKQLAPRFDEKFTGFSPAAENALLSYSWPGNDLELRHVVERAMVLASGPVLEVEDLTAGIADGVAGSGESRLRVAGDFSGIRTLEEVERQLVVEALRATGGHRTRAASLLGISRDQLRYRLRKFDLES